MTMRCSRSAAQMPRELRPLAGHVNVDQRQVDVTLQPTTGAASAFSARRWRSHERRIPSSTSRTSGSSSTIRMVECELIDATHFRRSPGRTHHQQPASVPDARPFVGTIARAVRIDRLEASGLRRAAKQTKQHWRARCRSALFLTESIPAPQVNDIRPRWRNRPLSSINVITPGVLPAPQSTGPSSLDRSR
jgi:hypothetical protein